MINSLICLYTKSQRRKIKAQTYIMQIREANLGKREIMSDREDIRSGNILKELV